MEQVSRYDEVEQCALDGNADGIAQLMSVALQPRSFFKRRARAALSQLGILVCDDAIEEQELRA